MTAWNEERRPIKDRSTVAKLMDELADWGLAVNKAGSRQNGKPAEWLRTDKGAAWVVGFGGGVCTCS